MGVLFKRFPLSAGKKRRRKKAPTEKGADGKQNQRQETIMKQAPVQYKIVKHFCSKC